MSGKKFADATKRFDREQLFTPTEALALAKSLAPAKFDETIEIAMRLGVDPRKADQMVRGTVALPSGTGKNVRIAVFANGEAAQAARDAGADMVGAEDLFAERIMMLQWLDRHQLVRPAWILRLLRAQLPDGGWKARNMPPLGRSNQHTTIIAMSVLADFRTWRLARRRAAT